MSFYEKQYRETYRYHVDPFDRMYHTGPTAFVSAYATPSNPKYRLPPNNFLITVHNNMTFHDRTATAAAGRPGWRAHLARTASSSGGGHVYSLSLSPFSPSLLDRPDNKRTSTPRLIVRRRSHHHRGDTRGPLPPAPPQLHCAARRRRETT